MRKISYPEQEHSVDRGVVLSLLKDHAHFAEELGSAIYSEWREMYQYQQKSEREVIETVKSRAVDDRIPFTMTAHENGVLMGSVTVKISEGTEFPELSPWLAGVFVLPEFRGRGIGKALVLRMEQEVHERFGVQEIYLYTSTAAGLYEKLGYRSFFSGIKDGKAVQYMKKRL